MDMRISRTFAAAIALMVGLAAATSADQTPPAFTVGIEMPCQVPVSKAVESALREMGIGYVNYYLKTFVVSTDRPASEIQPPMLDLCARLGMDWSIATYEADPPDDAVREAAKASAAPGRKGRFRGIVFDELEHSRLLNFTRPLALADYKHFTTLDQAERKTVVGFEKLHARFAALGAPVVATHVFPVLLHAAARAGFTVCPKIEKEFYSPVSLAIGMGAAKQYGRDLWADCDLWYYDLVPGHPVDEFRCNLLFAYWMGVDLTYVEGSGINLYPAGNQGIPFSLMTQITPELYQLTPHGEALRWFAREYVPKHPRPWTFRDVKPTIAIVRFDDTDFGQRYLSGFSPGLYGTETILPDADTEAWFQIWNTLTAGKTGRDGITYFRPNAGMSGFEYQKREGAMTSYATRPAQADFHRFFVPLNGAVVYDHTVGYNLLKDVPLLFLTGKEVSAATMDAIRRCVREGAICAVWGPLAHRSGFADWKSGTRVTTEGKGKWIVTDDFGAKEITQECWQHLGRADTVRYRFGPHDVILRRITDNQVSVEVDGVVQ
jgi:hypothetical protein